MTPQINKWVNNLLNLYQYSRIGNAGNRGLNSDFAHQTYIETELDSRLLPEILEGRYNAIFLTGNPGDGKTAYLEKVHDNLKMRGAAVEQKDASGWTISYKNHTYTSCYDASESFQNKSSDERLKIFLKPLSGYSPPNNAHTVLIAINDGKLHSFFHLPDVKRNWQWLANTVIEKAFKSGRGKNQDKIAIVNLKERTLVDFDIETEDSNSSLFDKLLTMFTYQENWLICGSCSSQSYCPIIANVNALGLYDQSNKVKHRLKTLFLISHLRRNRHNTIRDIRSALSYIITANLDCKAVHETSTLNPDNLYFNSIFKAKDDVLAEFRELDPATIALPSLDRQLHLLYRQNMTEKIMPYIFKSNTVVDIDDFELWFKHIRRKLFFEGEEEKFEDYLQEVTDWSAFLPYRYFGLFIQHLCKQGDLIHLCQLICRGISQMEGIKDTGKIEYKSHLLLRVDQSVKEGLTICKKISSDEFKVFTPNNKLEFIETIPDKIIFKHEKTGIQCVLTLDIFEVLLRLSDGQLPLSQEQKAVLDELNDFKSRLHRYHAKDLLLIESNGQVHHITQQNGKIIRQTAETHYEN